MAVTAAELNVLITSKGASVVQRDLKGVGSAVDQLAKNMSRMGSEGAEDLERVGNAASGVRIDINALSTAMTGVGSAMAYAGNLAMEQERQIVGLQFAFGDAADEMLRFAQELDDLTMFSDDDIRAGERFFATLNTNYDMSIDQIQELMSITADLASVAGVSFEDASNRITAAIRGEAEAAEWLGLTMNQAAIDTDNLTLSMSNAEAAQFRYNALLDQSSVYQGAAAAMAETSAGRMADLRDTMDDLAASAGGFIGPLGSMIGGLGMAATGVGGLTGAFSKLSGVMGGVLPRLATIATNPIFLGGAAIAGGIVVWDKLSDAMNRADRDQQELSESSANLAQTLSDMRVVMGQLEGANRFELAISQWEMGIDSFRAKLAQAQEDWERDGSGWLTELGQQDPAWSINAAGVAEELWKFLDLTDQEITDVNNALTELGPLFTNTAIDQAQLSTEVERLFAAFQETGDVDALVTGLGDLRTNSQDFLHTTNELATALAGLQGEIDKLEFMGQADLARDVEQLGTLQAAVQDVLNVLSEGEAQAYNEAWETVWDGIRSGEVDADAVIAKIAALDEQLASGQITHRQYASAMVQLGLNIDDFAIAADSATRQTRSLAEGMELLQVRAEAARLTFETAGAAVGQFAAETAEANAAAAELVETAGGLAGAFATEEIDAYNAALQETISTVLELSGNADITSQLNMTSAASQASILAERITDVGTALDNTFRAIVGNTNAISSQMQGIADWATDLIGDPGYWAEIDNLLNEGRISLEKYNQAQQAQIDITQANATVQRDLLAIQASQAPILAANSQNMADYVQRVRMMNDGFNDAVTGAQDQLATLALMDQGYQNQLLQVMEMATALDDLGAGGEAAFTSMIDSMVAFDPAMAAVLEKVGYIDNVVRDQDGRILSYDVQIDGADGAISEIKMLTNSIDALTRALGGKPPSYDVEVTGIEDVEAAERSIYDLIAAANQDAVVRLTTVLDPPAGFGDGTGGPLDFTGIEPVQIPVVYSPPESNWTEDGWTGGWAPEPVEIPTQLTPPDVNAMTALALMANPIRIPSEIEAPAMPELPQPEPLEIPVVFYVPDMPATNRDLGQNIPGAGDAGIDTDITITIDAQDNATAVIQDVGSSLAGLDSARAMVVINGDNAAAMQSIGDVSAGLFGIDGMSSTVLILGDNSDALADIGWAEGLNGTVLSTTFVDIVTRQIGSPQATGFSMGASMLAGWDAATGTNSPSTAMIERGQYLFQGLDIGWGSESRDLPIGFDVASPAYAGHGMAGGYSEAASASRGPSDRDVHVQVVNNGTIIGIDDLENQVGGAVIQALAAEGVRYGRAHGRATS